MLVVHTNLPSIIITYHICIMAKGKGQKFKLISLESGKECGHIRMNPMDLDKTKRFMRFDNHPEYRKHVECKLVPIKKAGTKALANSQKAGE